MLFSMEKLTEQQSLLVGDAFVEHGKLVTQIARKYSSRGSIAEFGDLESYLNEKFIEAVLRYDASRGCSLGAYLNTRLNQHALNYINSAYAGYNSVSTPFSTFEASDEDDGSFSPYVISDDYDLQADVIKGNEVKETIAVLFKNANDLQKRIMCAYLATDVKPTYTQIGKVVGVHHETVRRELAKLAKLTDFDINVL